MTIDTFHINQIVKTIHSPCRYKVIKHNPKTKANLYPDTELLTEEGKTVNANWKDDFWQLTK
jgi:hypothetical protein